jgi:hypothetical protein
MLETCVEQRECERNQQGVLMDVWKSSVGEGLGLLTVRLECDFYCPTNYIRSDTRLLSAPGAPEGRGEAPAPGHGICTCRVRKGKRGEPRNSPWS